MSGQRSMIEKVPARPRRAKKAAKTQARPLSPEAERWVSRPRQTRSQRTLMRLVDAGARLLEDRPMSAITVGDLVEAADSSVGSFYARFKDKDAYLAFLHEHYQQQVVEGIDALLNPERTAGMSTEALLRDVMPAFVATHRDVGGLMRALHAQSAVDESFRTREEQMNRHISQRFAEVLAPHRGAIRHPDPDRAIDFAVVSMLGALIQRVFFRGPGAQPFDDAQFTDHLVHAFLAHLRIEEGC